MPSHLELDDVVLLGRTFDEYRRIFALDDETLGSANILDVASGVSSFCAEASELGYRVTAADRIYGFGADEIEAKCQSDLEQVMAALPAIAQNYVWEIFEDVAALSRQRERAYQRFVEDFREYGSGRYVSSELPQIGFDDGEFDLILVSHLLFLYEEQLSYEFHQESLWELLRVGREVRIFPMVNLRIELSSYVTLLRDDTVFEMCTFEVRDVDYEFIRNGKRMMVVRANGSHT